MTNVQSSRASNTYTETQWAALMASVSARRAFSRGAFALVIADADGAFVGLYQKGQSGSAVGAFVLVAPVASGPPLSDATPAALGVAAPGTSPDAARGDHVHLLPPSVAPPTSGTLGARPAAPAAGDVYYAIDFDMVLTCVVAGTWRVMGADQVGVSLGPVAAAAYTASGIVSAVPGTAVGPTLANGQSIAIGFWISSVPTTEQVIASYQSEGNGYIVGINGNGGTSGYIYVLRVGIAGPGGLDKVVLGTQAVLVGANTLSLALVSNIALTWSLNGGAAATITTSGDKYTEPGADAHFILGNYQIAPSVPLVSGSLAWAQAWSATLDGSTLETVSSAYLSLLPGDPGAAACTYAWIAARAPLGVAQQDAVGNLTPLALNGTSALRRVRRL